MGQIVFENMTYTLGRREYIEKKSLRNIATGDLVLKPSSRQT
jgi:hypothetical protein